VSIFRPVGNTDEGSSSLGGSSRQWSPFSPFYNQRAATNKLVSDEREVIVKDNPLSAEQREKLLSRGEDTDPKTLVPVELALAIGGLIVNREWNDAADLCEKVVHYYHANIGATRAKGNEAKMAKLFAKSKHIKRVPAKPGDEHWAAWRAFLRAHPPKPASASSVTWGSLYGAIAEYCRAAAAGLPLARKARSAGERKHGAMVSLWDDVLRSALAKKGNVKLPFAAYSEMPIVTCPGAGGVNTKYGKLSGPALGAAKPSEPSSLGCASFCYSLKTFGKPSCIARYLVLTLGMSVDPVQHVRVVTKQMIKLAHARKPLKILRLFVDGDFRDARAIEVWMEAIKEMGQHGVKVYGYSKSWPEFIEVADRHPASWWPDNYCLNLSSGSIHYKNSAMLRRMHTLPITRGEFVAVDPMERLCWKAFGRSRGDEVYKAYTRRVDSTKDAAQANAEKDQLSRMIAEGDPELAKKYNAWLRNVHAVEDKKSGGAVVKRVARIIGSKGMGPGPVTQAATWCFLNIVRQPGEFSCPISCGACPGQAVMGLTQVLDAAVSGDETLMGGAKVFAKDVGGKILAAVQRGALKTHACNDKQRRSTIIIGLH